ncbi:MAG: hypothetical protein ISS47_07215 [Candidatus Omnitrophica bacterium]|nr:hypothetical protein [Candidatus Omnitrophota bacterium]
METRGAPRIKLKIKVSIEIDDSIKEHFNILHKDIDGEMVDISILGMGLLSKHFFR